MPEFWVTINWLDGDKHVLPARNLEIRWEPYECIHRGDDGRAIGSHASKRWIAECEGLLLLDCPECVMKWQQIMTRGCQTVFPDPVGDAVRTHPDWDPADPPQFWEQSAMKAIRTNFRA